VGQTVTLTPEVVRARLKALETLLGDLDAQFGPLQAVQQRQGTGMWTSIPACTQFAGDYARTLNGLGSALSDMRARVAELQASLAASAASLTKVDQDIQERLEALARKLAAGPPGGPLVCTPYDVVPASSTPAPTPAPAPAPAPTPTPTPTPASGGGGW